MNEVRKTVLEAHSDNRGWVVNPLVAPFPETPVGQVHIASLEPGAVRGNHYHPDSSEHVFVWGGSAEVVWQREDGGLVTERVGPSELAVFEIPARVVHAVVNTGDATVYLLAYYLGDSDREWPETERKEVV